MAKSDKIVEKQQKLLIYDKTWLKLLKYKKMVKWLPILLIHCKICQNSWKIVIYTNSWPNKPKKGTKLLNYSNQLIQDYTMAKTMKHDRNGQIMANLATIWPNKPKPLIHG